MQTTKLLEDANRFLPIIQAIKDGKAVKYKRADGQLGDINHDWELGVVLDYYGHSLVVVEPTAIRPCGVSGE